MRCSRTRAPLDVDPMALDIVGTGGDPFGAVLNISSMASIVAAAAGVPGRQARQPRRRARPPARPTCSPRSASTSTSTPERVAAGARRGGHHLRVRGAVPPRVPARRPDARASSASRRSSTSSARSATRRGPRPRPSGSRASTGAARGRRVPDPRRDRARLPRRRRHRQAHDHRPQPHLGGVARRRCTEHDLDPADLGIAARDDRATCSAADAAHNAGDRARRCSRATRARCATSCCSTPRPGSSSWELAQDPTQVRAATSSSGSASKLAVAAEAIDSGAAAAKLDEWVATRPDTAEP